MSEERDRIWQSIKGSEKLFEIYGFYPSLHDASITNFEVRFESKEIILTFEYADGVEEVVKTHELDEYDGCTQITLSWHGVTESKLRLYSNDIYRFDWELKDQLIETRFSHTYGVDGYILAQRIELISVNPSLREKVADVNEYLNTPNFSFAP